MTEKPNIIFIYPDQMRGSAMGFLNEEPVITPNLDAFAEESLVLTEAASNYPVCVPFRTIMMTGKYPVSNGVRVNCFCDGVDLPNHHIWWTDILSENGYSVGYLGKWHISKPDEHFSGASAHWLPAERRHGIDYYEIHVNDNHLENTYVSSCKSREETLKVNDWTPVYETDRAIEYIKNTDGGFRHAENPFALIISYNPPHTPYDQVPEKYLDLYDKDVEEYCKGIGNIPSTGTVDGDYYRKHIKEYYAAITGIDHEFGRIMECLKEQGIDENTIVVFTSDHGDLMGRHISWDHKNFPWEEAMRIPMIVRWPGQISPGTDDLLFSTADYYPTLMELAGINDGLPEDIEGNSYAPLILGKKQDRPGSQLYIHIEEPAGNPCWGRRGVRTDQYTLSINKMKDHPASCWLYDRKEDPWQLHDIALIKPDIVLALINNHLKPWLKKTGDPFEIPLIDKLIQS